MNTAKLQKRAVICVFMVLGAVLGAARMLDASPASTRQSLQSTRRDSFPLDLVGDRDVNGLLLNPSWTAQRRGPGHVPDAEVECGFRVATDWNGYRTLQSPRCTSQPVSLHEPRGLARSNAKSSIRSW